jgi:mxaJ protein
MCSGCSALRVVAASWLIWAFAPIGIANSHPFRVCADGNNLPYSNQRQEGFENAIAALLAGDLGQPLEYVWQPQRRGFIRTTLNAGRCDVVIGVPSGYELAETTRPYYTSTFVFVSQHARHLRLRSFDDPRLAHLVVGIQITGEDYSNPPPARALAARRLVDNVRGFPVFGDYSDAAPQKAIIDAVAAGRVDAAVVWGPLAGYFAARSAVPLDIEPVTPAIDRFSLPFTFAMSMAVRKGDTALRLKLDAAIGRRHGDIDAMLRRFGVPLVGGTGGFRS